MIAECGRAGSPPGASGGSISSAATIELIEWLVGDECHELDDAGLAAGFGRRLRAAGLPIDRLTLNLKTLHPEILGRSVAWAPNEAVEVRDREHGTEISAGFAGSPLRRVMETRKPVIVRLDGSIDPAWIHTDLFHGRGLIEFVIVPLCNADGLVSAATFSTTCPSGFAPSELAALDRIVPALRNACELRTLRRVELTLLDTYVGATTARRVMAGRIRRGEVETLEAGLMLCDLRGFTELSNRLPAERVLELLNAYFDRVVPAIADAGGEVVKFMGDAALAFFHRDSPAASCSAALQGSLSALEGLGRFAAPDAELHAGIALHYGEVGYGNIGSGRRLDFTVIGPDVNLVSRIQAVCSATSRPLLMSKRFAMLLNPGTAIAAGRYALTGFVEPAELYSLAGSFAQRWTPNET
ncbi:adenylate/guanylate cyclase domain-containing protein [Sinorhizobium psoraleae]|uniref:Adenylate/guanylate cyclase domain-containing protein n=1 Tax=Sinorhizobium psoraleae TaxID=520838 RepID=A0ABT4KFB2_9HYPH|nr:adenylate/guanylate cyclase domain-containing protein [Sinorhizobium psoraleae]MCZ4090665.1 adenylate/guanylate cyclase domain-containing protein [Sinorhizobium psoraleae]